MIEDLSGVQRVVVPRAAIAVTEKAVRAAGAYRAEAIVLWAGVRAGTEFRVIEAYIPEQQARPVEAGACVMVTGPALFRFNSWLWERRLELIAQVHSHPEEAYLSETDLEYPIATRVGNFSIVIPDFGRADLTIDDVAVFRYGAVGSWKELSGDAKRAMFVIEEV